MMASKNLLTAFVFIVLLIALLLATPEVAAMELGKASKPFDKNPSIDIFVVGFF